MKFTVKVIKLNRRFKLYKEHGMTWFHAVLQRLQQLIKCDKLSSSIRLNTTREWNNRNVWNDPALTVQDQLAKELSNKNITEHK